MGLSEIRSDGPCTSAFQPPDSEVVYFGLARDPGRRLLANGSSLAGSTATVVSSRSLTKPGFATSELLHFSEARCSLRRTGALRADLDGVGARLFLDPEKRLRKRGNDSYL